MSELKPLTREEIRPCDYCHKPLMHGHSLNVYRVRIESHVLDLNALQRQGGLETMLGSPALANVMSPERGYSVPLDHAEAIICFDCAVRHGPIALLETDGNTNNPES